MGTKCTVALTSTKSAVPNQLSGDAKGPRYTEQDGVVVHLVQAVMSEKNTGVGIYIRPRILGLAGLTVQRTSVLGRVVIRRDLPVVECPGQCCTLGQPT